ncbi:uncharacterized protein LOC124396695 [Silurus meridionalis]|uniref:Tubulin epsilon and delta complex protein 2 n=1 Tax=Silurus meridionalis TaxID=175797 RepID=A0A8T0AXK9_SILME|nr:uncharacterized protein LOC124396695 [Silurus meridionalis]KAF7698249.1 hypothetical protein HF521_004759 [Silurus meridionalis]
MSALVEEAIRLYRAEERKLTETIWLYKELLRSMKTRVKVSSEAETPDSIKDQGIPLKDRQELELLEQVLKKALKIRSSSAVILNYQENPCSSGSVDKAPAVKGRDKRNCQKSSLLSSELKGSHQHEGQLKSTAGCGNDATCQVPVKTGPSSRLTVRGKHSGKKPVSTQKTTTGSVQTRSCQVTSCSRGSDRGMLSVGSSSLEERTSQTNQESEMQSKALAPKEQWLPSPSLPLWQTQQAKKNKLWNKSLSRHSKPAPERDQFRKRLISTFPNEWSSVQIAAMEEELDVLTQLGLDLTHCYNADLQIHQLGWSPELSTEREYESLLMLTGLEKMMVQIIKEADRLKKDWERKMAWWYGALCPLHSRVEWHSSERPCIPPLLAYSSKGELEELQSLRLYVSQLKLEIHAHQAMCDTLINQISCESPSSNRPSATALRGVYSLLGEGGAQFPSLVLDNDSA